VFDSAAKTVSQNDYAMKCSQQDCRTWTLEPVAAGTTALCGVLRPPKNDVVPVHIVCFEISWIREKDGWHVSSWRQSRMS
jgi:hypothetical protein